MNHEMLSQIQGEIELSSQHLRRIAASPKGALPEADAAGVCAIAKDLGIKLAGFQNTRGVPSFPPWPQARVLTNTIDSATGELVQVWQVHYVAQALQDNPLQQHELSVSSSPAELRLPEADYVFWATKSGDAGASSHRVMVSVRVSNDSKPLPVDIPVHVKP